MPLNLKDNSFISEYTVGDRGLMCVLEGISGIGKTTIVEGLVQKFGREGVLICDLDDKLLPLRKLKPFRWKNRALTHTDEVLECLAWVESRVAAGAEDYPTVLLLDSFSEWSDLKKREVYAQFPKEKSYDRFDNLGMAGLDLVVAARRIPRVIKIFNLTMTPINDAGQIIYKPCLQGNVIGENLSRKVDELLFMGEFTFAPETFLPTHPLYSEVVKANGRPIRAIQTGVFNNINAKDSSRALVLWEPPSWPYILGKILDEEGDNK